MKPLQQKCGYKLTRLVLLGAMGWLLQSATGCVEGRSSTHELEHAVPEHWPASLVDAADKIDSRLATTDGAVSITARGREELIEIVSWLPEVAADSAMREPQWNTIHSECKQIETLMKSSSDIKSAESSLRALSQRLRELDRDLAVSP